MKIRAEIDGRDLVKNISFNGETHSDDATVKEIKELARVLEDVFVGLDKTHQQVDGRHEASAIEIKTELRQLRHDLYWHMIKNEDVKHVQDIIYEYEFEDIEYIYEE